MAVARRSKPGTGVLLCVLAGHLLLLALLAGNGAWRQRQRAQPAAAQPPLVVRLLALPMPAVPAGTAPPVREAQPLRAVRSLAHLPGARPVAPSGIDSTAVTAAALQPESPAPGAAQASAAAASAASDARPPLALDWRRSASAPDRLRNPALDDPRAQGRPPTMASRIAAAVGNDKRTEEAIGNGRIRFRQGTGCVEVRPNTQAGIDPFNQAVLPLPRGVTGC